VCVSRDVPFLFGSLLFGYSRSALCVALVATSAKSITFNPSDATSEMSPNPSALFPIPPLNGFPAGAQMLRPLLVVVALQLLISRNLAGGLDC